jgi:hypothetical protein
MRPVSRRGRQAILPVCSTGWLSWHLSLPQLQNPSHQTAVTGSWLWVWLWAWEVSWLHVDVHQSDDRGMCCVAQPGPVHVLPAQQQNPAVL